MSKPTSGSTWAFVHLSFAAGTNLGVTSNDTARESGRAQRRHAAERTQNPWFLKNWRNGQTLWRGQLRESNDHTAIEFPNEETWAENWTTPNLTRSNCQENSEMVPDSNRLEPHRICKRVTEATWSKRTTCWLIELWTWQEDREHFAVGLWKPWCRIARVDYVRSIEWKALHTD